ncbi:MAG: hypothetical protein U1F57_11535 [bacterium]
MSSIVSKYIKYREEVEATKGAGSAATAGASGKKGGFKTVLDKVRVDDDKDDKVKDKGSDAPKEKTSASRSNSSSSKKV